MAGKRKASELKSQFSLQKWSRQKGFTGYLFHGVGGEDVVVVQAKGFAQLLAQIHQLLQTLLDHLLPLGHVLCHGGLLLSDAGRALRLVELHLQPRTHAQATSKISGSILAPKPHSQQQLSPNMEDIGA